MKLTKKFMYLIMMVVGFILAYAAYVIYRVVDSRRAFKIATAADSLTFGNKLPKEYAQIAKNYNNMNLVGTINSSTRKPIVVMTFKEKFWVFLYKLPIEFPQPLNQLVKEDFTSSSLTTGVSYYDLFSTTWYSDDHNPYEIYCERGPIKTGKEIYLTISGHDTHIIKMNDSVVIYYSQFNDFSIRYNQDGDKDFYGRVKVNSLAYILPVQIEFLKHRNDVYLFIVTEKKER
jgi:hypothetical protein